MSSRAISNTQKDMRFYKAITRWKSHFLCDAEFLHKRILRTRNPWCVCGPLLNKQAKNVVLDLFSVLQVFYPFKSFSWRIHGQQSWTAWKMTKWLYFFIIHLRAKMFWAERCTIGLAAEWCLRDRTMRFPSKRINGGNLMHINVNQMHLKNIAK